jgi:hypothetical protein
MIGDAKPVFKHCLLSGTSVMSSDAIIYTFQHNSHTEYEDDITVDVWA